MSPSKATRDFMCCLDKTHKPEWMVTQRNCNYSAFNGYHWTPSDYSRVRCFHPGCARTWRTKAKYVDALPDAPADWSRG
jgi:hypothetical protein